MKKRTATIKVGKKTVEFNMGDLRASGHIPVHYDAILLEQDQELISKLINGNLAKVIHEEKPKKSKKIDN
jgi:hypothetical protein